MKIDASKIAESTRDAYSFFRYGDKSWFACCRMLARRGFNAEQIEAIMRSKWTRWAADAAKNHQKATSKDLERFLDDPRNQASTANVNRLVNGTL